MTVADELARWEAGLAGRPDVTIRVYDEDNHLFFPGTGLSAPAEYGPGNTSIRWSSPTSPTG